MQDVLPKPTYNVTETSDEKATRIDVKSALETEFALLASSIAGLDVASDSSLEGEVGTQEKSEQMEKDEDVLSEYVNPTRSAVSKLNQETESFVPPEESSVPPEESSVPVDDSSVPPEEPCSNIEAQTKLGKVRKPKDINDRTQAVIIEQKDVTSASSDKPPAEAMCEKLAEEIVSSVIDPGAISINPEILPREEIMTKDLRADDVRDECGVDDVTPDVYNTSVGEVR